MAASTAPALLAGGITLANEIVFAPLASGYLAGKGTAPQINWRIIPATAGLALALAGLEKIAPGFAVGLGWLAVATVLLVPLGNAPTPVQSAARALGYAQKVT